MPIPIISKNREITLQQITLTTFVEFTGLDKFDSTRKRLISEGYLISCHYPYDSENRIIIAKRKKREKYE